MWERLKIRERERMLGMLFASASLAIIIYVLLSSLSALAARLLLGVSTGILFLLLLRVGWRIRRRRGQRAPVGPLSPDERAKARSKLLSRKEPPLPR